MLEPIFISYLSSDLKSCEAVRSVCAAWAGHGYKLYSRDMSADFDDPAFRKKIAKQIASAKFVFLILGDSASKEGAVSDALLADRFVNSELRLAKERGIPIVVGLLDGTQFPVDVAQPPVFDDLLSGHVRQLRSGNTHQELVHLLLSILVELPKTQARDWFGLIANIALALCGLAFSLIVVLWGINWSTGHIKISPESIGSVISIIVIANLLFLLNGRKR